jgi:hypothetical protein
MAGKTFFAMVAAGAAFIAIGIASSVYSNVAVDVPLDGKVPAGKTDELTPNMDVGNTASLALKGSTFNVEIKDPSGKPIVSRSNQTSLSYNLTADREGQYRFLINNTGSEELAITGHAQTKASPLAFSAPLLLVITGIIVVALALPFRNR